MNLLGFTKLTIFVDTIVALLLFERGMIFINAYYPGYFSCWWQSSFIFLQPTFPLFNARLLWKLSYSGWCCCAFHLVLLLGWSLSLFKSNIYIILFVAVLACVKINKCCMYWTHTLFSLLLCIVIQKRFFCA